ncbi:hypothetical protein L3Q82_013667 [Scortum barcoo]|uniref:Uncharacterized protein n=1 Tax=Scortum barcoo TaxID=214431 RepID=A0ACB8W0X7_9TELE|nr:hypothetical protein L3Q82_013667 [Scortum barcoo]
MVLLVSHSKFIIQTAMNTQRHLTDEQRHLAIARLRVGGRQSDVARELGVSQSVISRLASRNRTTGRVRDRPRSGAPRVSPRMTDHNDDQYLRTYALRHRNATATQLQFRLQDVRGTRVSRQTIHNRLHRFGLNARRPLQVTPLTPRHRRERLQWAQDHVTWTMQQWCTVLFTDECQVTLHRNDGRQALLGEGESIWDQLKQRLDDRTPPPRDLAELRVALVEEWNALPQNNVMRLVRSMRRRYQAVIAANGGNGGN